MLARQEFDYVRDLVRSRAGIVLDDGKEYLVETRLAPLMRKRGLKNIGDVVRELRARPEPLSTDIVEALTTNETSFFRDARVYSALQNEVIPQIIDRCRMRRKIRIWSGACSTGQEPYTLAMMLHDEFPATRDWDIQILATDLDSNVLAKAQEARYSRLDVNRGLPAKKMAHFEIRGGGYHLKDHIKKYVRFEPLNLVRSWHIHGPFDLVLLRNVLIYFDNDTKRDILDRIRGLMSSDAVLILGGAETTLNVHDGYERVRFGTVAFYKPT